MILIALGGNNQSEAGTPLQTLRAALNVFKDYGITVKQVSPFYKTAPVPVSLQPDYINAVAAIETALQPHALLERLLEIEKRFGRVRGKKNAARTLDLDLIDYNGQVVDEHDLELPHPRMQDRAFVLYPLRDVAPNWVHPVSRKKIGELVTHLAPQGIQKIQ